MTVSGGYVYHAFSTGGTLTVSSALSVSLLLIGGGGGGGSWGCFDPANPHASPHWHGGGGGGGGYIERTAFTIAPGTYSVVVGAGGAGGTGGTSGWPPEATTMTRAEQVSAGFNGQDTTAFGLTALGGGYGGQYKGAGGAGGSGGGQGRDSGWNGVDRRGAGTPGQGHSGGGGGTAAAYYAGGNGAGGGGAGGAGADAGVGGVGKYFAWAAAAGRGEGGYFSGGGGGGGMYPSDYTACIRLGGVGGGGDAWVVKDCQGNSPAHPHGASGTGGGGGSAGNCQTAGSGGSGLILLRRPQ